MGNSEVGHLNLGAGFIVEQDLTRLTAAIDDGSFFDNAALRSTAGRARERGSTLHLMGLIGEGGVHAHTRHLLAVVELAKREGVEQLCLHAFTDGRDTPPDSGLGFMHDIETRLQAVRLGRVASVTGRYWAMDRDHRWDRTRRAWAAVVGGEGRTAASPVEAIEQSYAAGVSDEFIEPTVVLGANGQPLGVVNDGDVVVMFNFRADRMRQLLAAFTEPGFDAFPRRLPSGLEIVTMTKYTRDQPATIAFPSMDVSEPLARVVSDIGLRQFHTAETEKYAHVTYFFNGGREQPFEGEDRLLVPSPQVATYDLQPEMSALEVTDGLTARIAQGLDDFIIVNYANPDMVGHTGNLGAAKIAVATVDACLGRVLAALEEAGGAAIVTADHGNAEMMIDPETGGPYTAHTLNPVPVVLVGVPGGARQGRLEMADGRLSDVAPTILELMGLPAPESMTGRSLIGGRSPHDGAS
jgi:2,3-bisphosphoglycerate-independent phosphoglycerate mutase